MIRKTLLKKLLVEQKKYNESELRISHQLEQQKSDGNKIKKENEQIKNRVSKRFKNI